MILEIIAMFLVILILTLPFCMYPIFIAMAVNKSHKITKDGDRKEY